jgi:hypothetical protein
MGLVFGLTSFGSIFILPLFLQQLRGYSILDSGLSQMPRMLVMMVAAPLAGRLYSWVDSCLVIGGGIAMMMGGYVQMSHFTLHVGAWEMLPGLLLTGAGMAFTFSDGLQRCVLDDGHVLCVLPAVSTPARPSHPLPGACPLYFAACLRRHIPLDQLFLSKISAFRKVLPLAPPYI